MNGFRAIFLMRVIVFFMISMVMFDSIDPPDLPRIDKHTDSSTNATFVDKAVFEHNEDHKESRVSGVTETSLYENPISEIDFSNLAFIIVELNSPNTTSLFESRSSDLPSPPPKGSAITFVASLP